MEPDAQLDEAKAPYISYQTLTAFIDTKLGANPLPPRIDRGFLDSYAGSVQAQLLQTLRTMGFVTETGALTEALREAARHPNARKAVTHAWAQGFYADQGALAAQNATAHMLYESFAKNKYTGSTLRKAIVFYLTLVDDVGMQKSPHFKPPRQQSPTGGSRRRGNQASIRAVVPDPSNLNPTPPVVVSSGERKIIRFETAGSVTIDVQVKWLDLPIETFTKLRTLIGELELLGDEGSDNVIQIEAGES